MPATTNTTSPVEDSTNKSNAPARQTGANANNNNQAGAANFPPPKTDKPRPHVCGTCSRSFARLEHLKRHERSHTKEKPFECPECTRCFARRDLLLRHQQKLHMTATPSSRPRNGRRESTSSVAAGGRVRKNSVVNAGTTGDNGRSSARPRANTISHVDNATLGMIAAANSSVARGRNMGLFVGHPPNLNHLAGTGGYGYRGMSSVLGHHGNPLGGLPRIETNGLNIDMSGGLRTAPPFGDPAAEFEMDNIFGPGSTINPAQLHFNDSPGTLAMGTPPFDFSQGFNGGHTTHLTLDEEDNMDWVNGFENQMSFGGSNEHALDGSSPSAISTASQSGISEVMLDGSNNPAQSAAFWQNSMMAPAQVPPNQFTMDLSTTAFPDLVPPAGTVSPESLQARNGSHDPLFSTPPPLTAMDGSSVMPGMPGHSFQHPMNFNSDTTSTSSASVSGSGRQSSITSVSTDSITDATRTALLASLSQPAVFGHRHRSYSQSSVNSPMSPGFAQRSSHLSTSLPSTADLQRYVTSYIQYFHPHLPFLHVSSLKFDSPAYSSNPNFSGSHPTLNQPGVVGGGGCLMLAMAAIGALYEYEVAASRELFEASKKVIQIYLEERRKADMTVALGSSGFGKDSTAQNTPLWLVQAMLLNVIYGHNCGDKTAGDIASTHCAALVSLTRAADLARPVPLETFASRDRPMFMSDDQVSGDDFQIRDEWTAPEAWNLDGQLDDSDEQAEWSHWKLTEERKRTLYAVFITSSLLVSAYNHAPALINSEIRLDLPCNEDLWAAENSQAWNAKGGRSSAEREAIPFANALSSLLTAGQRQPQLQQVTQPYNQHFGSGAQLDDLPGSELKPSTFGCLVLINALHNYIWETRQQHINRQWTPQETEAMHAHIEPALKAWQAAWASNPHHSLERPHPYGMGPLSADSIPLLDLAYVRLFVDLGRSKEAFWQRDFDAMADELARNSEEGQQTDMSSSPDLFNTDSTDAASNMNAPNASTADQNVLGGLYVPPANNSSNQAQHSGQSSKRERYLRKAAFYAADSLSMSDKLGVTFADYSSRELPVQSAMCAFDCAQVLAEWVSTVQERVGRYLGILGKDDIDYGQVPGIMLLDDEDCKLLEKIADVLRSAEVKLAFESKGSSILDTFSAMNGLPSTSDHGYGSKILLLTAYMLEKAAVWPMARLMARSLETEAAHMKARAEQSVLNRQ
ncbi:MAG: hypothetical protein M1819_000419 [Sarea resinae]|nr:MAG: hypothetical protein M1819_000419 [Sarea resinae]